MYSKCGMNVAYGLSVQLIGFGGRSALTFVASGPGRICFTSIEILKLAELYHVVHQMEALDECSPDQL
jgi:hypothetical protein